MKFNEMRRFINDADIDAEVKHLWLQIIDAMEERKRSDPSFTGEEAREMLGDVLRYFGVIGE